MTPLLFVGDSITRSWADAEATLFASRGWHCTARAGETTEAIGRRLVSDLDHCRPARVHILCGINDIAENAGPYDPDVTKRNLAAMAAACASRGAACIMATPLPAVIVPWRPGMAIGDKVSDLVLWMRENFLDLPHVILIDYHSAYISSFKLNPQGLTIDGIHPNADGLRLLTKGLLENL